MMFFLQLISCAIFTYGFYLFFKNNMSKKKVYIVEGNIGTGKTTFLKILESFNEHEVIYEPVDVWTQHKDTDGKNILEKFYTDFKRWAYTMQSFAFKTRFEAQSKPQTKKIRFIERSVFTDYFVFAHNCFLTNLMTKLEWCIYKQWFKNLLHVYQKAGYKVYPDGYIYLRCSPEISKQRIEKRKRDGESDISLYYLTQISNLHDKWLYSKKNNIPVLTINCNEDFENDIDYQNIVLEKLSNFI